MEAAKQALVKLGVIDVAIRFRWTMLWKELIEPTDDFRLSVAIRFRWTMLWKKIKAYEDALANDRRNPLSLDNALEGVEFLIRCAKVMNQVLFAQAF